MARLDISRLNRNRSIYLKFGFLFALAFVTFAFNLEIHPDDNFRDYAAEEEAGEEILVIPRTVLKKKSIKVPIADLIEIKPETIEEAPTFETETIQEVELLEVSTTSEVVEMNDLPQEQKPKPPKPPLPPDENLSESEPLIFAEEMPRFPGCEEEGLNKQDKKQCAERALMSFIYSQIKYPAMAKEVGEEGTVFVEFVVRKNGNVDNFKVLREPGAILGKEALRVVNKMPRWIPGKQRGRPVAVRYRLPIKFELLD